MAATNTPEAWEKARGRVKAEWRKYIEAAKRIGWRVDPDAGYVTLYPPKEAPNPRPITVPSTPGRGRGLANFERQLQRAGMRKEDWRT